MNKNIISKSAQLRALVSPIRQEIFDTVKSSGECSIKELAVQLGIPADGLYYHIRVLKKNGLLIEKSLRKTSRRDEITYSLPDNNMSVEYNLDDINKKKIIKNAVGSMLKMVERDFGKALKTGNAIVKGPARELWATRYKIWLDKKEVREVNIHLKRLEKIFSDTQRGKNKKLYSLSFVISPMEEKPARRK